MEQFTRGKNPFKSLRIGKRAIIDNWFKTWVPRAEYKIDDDLKIYVKRSLNLSYSNVTFLPDNLSINGYLALLKGTKITSLPDNLHIEKWLNLWGTKITFLPDNLYVREYLYMNETKIISLPDNLHVGGRILKDF